jgi:hypothetical protein
VTARVLPAAVARLLPRPRDTVRRAPGDVVTPKPGRPRCGAKTRQGTPCQAPPVWDHRHDRPRNGRCRLHGGLSTGPKTPEGKRRVRELMRIIHTRRRAAKARKETT